MDTVNSRLKYFIYCRRSSTDDEDKQVLSIEAQLRELKEYAHKCNLHIVEILTESKSAHKPGRDVFNSMIARFEAREANALLVWQINRIARNAKDGGNFIQLMDDGIITQVDTPHKQYRHSGDDMFFMNLEFGMAKKFSDDLSDSVKRGIRQKYERGEYPNFAPLGYLNVKVHGYKNIIPDPDKADLVAKLFEEYATGRYSLGQMTKVIAAWGLKTRNDKPVVKSHLHRILQNPIYSGSYNHGGELHKGSYKPIIEEDVYVKVQAVLQNKSKPKKLYQDWAFANLIKCGCHCGSSIIFETKRKYYKGTDRWADYTYARSSKRCGECLEKGTTLDDLENQILDKLEAVTIDLESWQLGIELVQAKYDKESQAIASIVSNRQREHARLETELDGYFKMRAREEMSLEDFQQRKQKIRDQQKELLAKIGDGMQAKRHWLELMQDFLDTALEARNMIQGDDLDAKRKAVVKVGWNLELKDKQLVWTYRKPYDVLLKPEYRSDLRRGRDSNSR